MNHNYYCLHTSFNGYRDLNSYIKRLAINANGNTITSFARELNPTGVGEYIYIYIVIHTHTHTHTYIYHHHHIALVARISLTLSRHSSLSFITLGRSSGQHPVSSHSCWMYVRADRPAFAHPCVGIHKSTSLMSSSLLLQQCPACLVRLTWIVFVIGGRWPYSWCLVGCCCAKLRRGFLMQSQRKTTRNVLVAVLVELDELSSSPSDIHSSVCEHKSLWALFLNRQKFPNSTQGSK